MKVLWALSLAFSFCPGCFARDTDRVLLDLRAAVAQGDGHAVHSLTEELRLLVPIREKRERGHVVARDPKPGSAPLVSQASLRKGAQTAPGSLSVDVPRNSTSQTKFFWQPESVFDEELFALTEQDQDELQQQLQDPIIQQALLTTKTEGWYLCAMEGEKCTCPGQVRYGNPHRNVWSEPVQGPIVCSVSVFGDPLPGVEKQCGCHRTAFVLEKHENSGSLLQESFIFLLRFLARAKMIPFTGDRVHHGTELWVARHGGKGGGTLERFWIDKFVYEAQPHVSGPYCLEWGIWYTNYFPQCTTKYEVKFEPVHYGQTHAHVEGNIVYGSVYDFPGIVGNSKLNFICATQLFEHLERPHEAAKALFHILAPGGSVLYTAPQQAQYHKVPEDYMRYTKAGVKYLFESAGFCVPPDLMSGGGDYIFDTGRNMGLQIHDFTLEEMLEGYRRGYDQIADGAITINALAFKPPHALCLS